MRTVSFAGLHRMLRAIADSRRGLTAAEVNQLVHDQWLTLTPHRTLPAPTTIFHYRNTLIQLGLIKRSGRFLEPNLEIQPVRSLVNLPPPAKGDETITDAARHHFASVVLTHPHCRTLFFDLFMPNNTTIKSVSDFTNRATPVSWYHTKSHEQRELVFNNVATGRTITDSSSVARPAILYGIRYWARDQLRVIDEYVPGPSNQTLMFPITLPTEQEHACPNPLIETALRILTLETIGDWIYTSISDLIGVFCVTQRKSISTLYRTIDWMISRWPHHVVLIPTSESIATLPVSSSTSRSLFLRKYYRRPGTPYISHIRLHHDILNDLSKEFDRYE